MVGAASQTSVAVTVTGMGMSWPFRTQPVGGAKVIVTDGGVVSCTVTRVWRGPGALVDGTAATPVVQLATSSALEFVAEATERDLARLAPGNIARGTLVSGEDFTGAVRTKSTALDPQTGLGTVRVALEPPSKPISIGTFGRVVLTSGHREGVLLLPSSALRGAVADGAEVALCQDGKATLRAVKVGFRDDARFEPLEGVAAGERVAIEHVLGLTDGTAIQELP